jgi:septum formation protein
MTALLVVDMDPSHRLLLASESPRRREMITWLNLACQVTRVELNENPHAGELPRNLAVRLAEEKARAVTTKYHPIWILAADTIVDFSHQALGKPADAAQAHAMLCHLREGPHQVHTGLTLFHPATEVLSTRCVTTDVWMRPYTDAEIDAYIASGDPMDKAGAYAVQHAGFHPVSRLDRCYANVVGLPLCALVELLQIAGFAETVDIPRLCFVHFGYNCPQPDRGIQI